MPFQTLLESDDGKSGLIIRNRDECCEFLYPSCHPPILEEFAKENGGVQKGPSSFVVIMPEIMIIRY